MPAAEDGGSWLLALLPPPDAAQLIQDWRAAHGVRDAAAAPHVTAKARSGLGGPAQAWTPAARAVASGAAPVPLRLGAPRLFPRGQALYLPVHSPQAVRLHLALLDALQPEVRFGYEGPGMQPHLSLALGHSRGRGRRGADLPRLLAAAEAELQPLAGLGWTAHHLTLMRKPGPGGAYRAEEHWPLGAAPTLPPPSLEFI